MYRLKLAWTVVLCVSMGTSCVSAPTSQSRHYSGSANLFSAVNSRPAILMTDLRFKIEDIDDHFDTALFLRSREFRKLAIVLDGHENPDGERVLEHMYSLTGDRVPYAKGLKNHIMQSPDDQALDNSSQQGVNLLLSALRNSREPVHIITTGSLTDLAVALNREPDLLSEKVSCVYVVAGWLDPEYKFWRYFKEPAGPSDAVLQVLALPDVEPNVSMDPLAFARVMGSGLPIVWAPDDVNHWMFPAVALLEDAEDPLTRFVLNELLHWNLLYRNAPWWSPDGSDAPDRYFFYRRGCKLYSTPAILFAAGLGTNRDGPFEVADIDARFNEAGSLVSIEYGAVSARMKVIDRIRPELLNGMLASRLGASGRRSYDQ